VREKLLVRNYETPHPMELIAYTEIDLLLPYDTWFASFAQQLRDMLERSTFERLWVFSRSQHGSAGNVKFVHPAL